MNDATRGHTVSSHEMMLMKITEHKERGNGRKNVSHSETSGMAKQTLGRGPAEAMLDTTERSSQRKRNVQT